MSKIVLKEVDLLVLNNFVDSLIPLSDTSTVYFKIDKDGISSDAHNDSATVVKCVSKDIGSICKEHNLDKVDGCVRVSFWDGKKLKKILSMMSGTDISFELEYSLVDDDTLEDDKTGFYGKQLKVISPTLTMTLSCADPTLIDFANVPEDSIAELNDVTESGVSFNITSNEIMQIQKYSDVDTNEVLTFSINGNVTVSSEGSFDYTVDSDFVGSGNELKFRVAKHLFSLIDVSSYTAYPCIDDEADRFVLKSRETSDSVIITLDEPDEEL